ncbi:MAG: hypothetical protein QNJ46_30090 [Leptolyngbyaceae cyanobacterium MO_188.B28]|nr:hypothetical protein [Leptolyngbyaceae cyanobacterium MO_188.B28]
MGQKRMRYQWFQDVPRNVTRREYGQLQFRNFCAVGLGLGAAMMLISSVFGLTLQTSRTLAEIDDMSIKAAIAHEGDRIDLVQLEGYLVADNPPTMPDNDAQKVIRGQVKLSARTGENSGADGAESIQKETLFEWEESADTVFLSDGDRRILLAFDLAVLPMESDLGDLSPRTIRQGESARTRRPVAVEYGDEHYPLPLDRWGDIDSVFTDFERQVLPHGQSVVVTAGLETTAQGVQLIDPLGDRLQVLIGAEADIRQQGERLRVMFLILAFPFGFASFLVGRSALRLRQEFVERSNQ